VSGELFKLKYDGFHALPYIGRDCVRLFSRNPTRYTVGGCVSHETEQEAPKGSASYSIAKTA
jgi:hypothetical protein